MINGKRDYVTERIASAAHQTGGKFAHANLMTGWGVGRMQWLGGARCALELNLDGAKTVPRKLMGDVHDTKG